MALADLLPSLETCEVAVILPVHGHPALLSEALLSLFRQQEAPAFRVAIVVDGCPLRQTMDTALRWARAHPGRIAVLPQRQAGLAAARNAGIRFALAAWPGCRALYFLDADNAIGPALLRRALAALDAAPPEIGWIQADFDMFGMAANWSTAGRYSLVQHLAENVCDAGAMVRRAVFEAGLRFTDGFRAGFEDWDFWLGAAGHGFRGQHLPASGFRYRRRPESLVRSARRRGAELLEAMRARHPLLYAPRPLLALEAAEAPRYAIFGAEEAEFLLDPSRPAPAMPQEAALAALAAAAGAPGACHAPAVVAVAAPGAMAALRAAGLAPALFALAETLLDDTALVRVAWRGGGERLGLRPAGAVTAEEAALLLMRSATLHGLARGREAAGRLPWRGLEMRLPGEPPPAAPGAAEMLEALAGRLGGLAPPPRRGWRRDGRIARSEAAGAVARAAFGTGPLLPLEPRPGLRDIAMVVPGFGLGGVERVLLALAGELAEAGWRAHLCVTGQEEIAAPPAGAFASVTLLPGFHAERHRGGRDAYFGAGISTIEEAPGEAAALLGLLAPMQAVLVTHAFAGHGLAGRLRALGVRMLCGLHLSERGPFGAPEGTPHIALGYEHAYHHFVVHAAGLARWCAAEGVPEEKILVLPNAPGYAATPAALEAARARPPAAGRKLRALVLGRLDRQKGPDRLPGIVAAAGAGVEWRVVGQAELDAALPALPVPVEPPSREPAALDALYGWADVLVMPSRFEGVPLAVLEAQRLGCVPVAARVGGLAEAVADGEDGLLVPPGEDRVVPAMAAALRRLAADPDLLARLARGAVVRGASRSWRASARPLIEALGRA